MVRSSHVVLSIPFFAVISLMPTTDQNNSELHALLNACAQLFEDKFKTALNQHLPNVQSHSDGVVMLLLAKSFKTCRAISILTSKGYGEDAIALLRTIFENYVNLAYIIQEDSDHRFELFITHAHLDYANKLGKGSETDYEYSTRIHNAEKDRIKQIYGRYSNTWSHLSLGKLSEIVNCKNGYDKIYWLLSQQTHPHAKMLGNYTTNGSPDDSPSPRMIEEALLYSIEFILKLLSLTNEKYSCGLGVDIDKLSQTHKKLTPI